MVSNVSGVEYTPTSLRSNAGESLVQDEKPVERYADSVGTWTVNPSLTRSHNVQWLKSPQTSWSDAWFERAASIPSPLNDF